MSNVSKEALKAAELWQEFLKIVTGRYSQETCENFFVPMEPISFFEGTITMGVESPFIEDWVSGNYTDLIQDVLSQIAESPVRLELVVRPKLEASEAKLARKKPRISKAPEKIEQPVSSPMPKKEHKSSEVIKKKPLFDERYTFENFIGGDSNALALAAAQGAVKSPGERYNPIYIYGGPGLGKTHLLHAIGQEIAKNHPTWQIAYLSANDFLNEYLAALREKKMEIFEAYYCSACQVLLIDDIQFITGKPSTQDELFKIFELMRGSHKQLVFAADKLPSEIPDITDRLVSRLGSGLIADIQAPELETRVAILQKKAAAIGLKLSSEVAFYVASAIPNDVRNLEGALMRLSAEYDLNGRPLSTSYAKEILGKVLKINPVAVSVADINEAVSEFYHLDPKLLTSQTRTKKVARPRQVAMYLCYKHLSTSYPALAKDFNRKDHTTILSACRKIETLLGKSEAEIVEAINAIEKRLRRG